MAQPEEMDAEKIAQRFAGAFLMPADALWHEIGKCRASISIMELVHLKKLFGVSIQAITRRCKDLGIIGKVALPGISSALLDWTAIHGARKPRKGGT